MEKDYPGGKHFVRTAFLQKGIPAEAIHGMISSVSTGTFRQYETCFKRWWSFCKSKNNCPYTYSLQSILEFLNSIFKEGKTYSLLNSHRSALSLIFQIDVKDMKLISRYLKGIYNQRPGRPKYDNTWDPQPVLSYLSKLFPLDDLNLKCLTFKLCTLLALVSAHRMQTLAKIKLDDINPQHDRIEIFISDRLKTSGPRSRQPVLILPFFIENPRLCAASTLQKYIERTRDLRPEGENRLLLTVKRPFHAASSQTISRYIKNVLTESGIDTDTFSGYSTRHASTSAAFRAGVDIEIIRRTAGWTKSSQMFCRFYNRPVCAEPQTFAQGVLQSAKE